MTMKRLGWVGSLVLLMMSGATSASSQGLEGLPIEASTAMSSFLDAWLVEHDREETLAYISGSIRSQEVAPRSVWVARHGEPGLSEEQKEAYWEILKRLGGSVEAGESLESTLTLPDRDLVDLVHREGRVIQPWPFIVLIADTDVAINGFHAGYGNVATALEPTENLVLTMIADYNGRQREETGPFIAFWSEEDDGWRIQALGAVPHEAAWLDDGR